MGFDGNSCDLASPGRFYRRACEAFLTWDEREYTRVRTLSEARCGKIVVYDHKPSGASFAVKVMPKTLSRPNSGSEADERATTFKYEDPLNEVGVLAYLADAGASDIVPKPQHFYTDSSHDYIAIRYCPGGDLFDRISALSTPFPEATLRGYVRQILTLTVRLHRANIAHRDISLENLLVDEDETLKLIDFSQAVPIRKSSDVHAEELRYFVPCGKDHCRAPEATVPLGGTWPLSILCPNDGKAGRPATVVYQGSQVDVLLPDSTAPGRPCQARAQGYLAAPVDVFACGACFFAMAFLRTDARARPRSAKGGPESLADHLRRCDLESRRPGSGLPRPALELLEALLHPDARERITAEAAMQHPWLTVRAP